MSELAVGSLKGLAANDFVIDVAAGSTLNVPPPAILQVVSASKTNTFSSSGTSFQDITGLEVTITPSSASSKIMILAQIVVSMNTQLAGEPQKGLYFRLTGGNSDTYIGDAEGSRTRAIFGAQTNQFPPPSILAFPISFLDSPNTTSAVTYKVQGRISISTFHINRSASDINNAVHGRGASSITVMEVAG